ncbi:MAG: hypothetical protein IT458_12005 [Planctomycetes bacterium]|nr:hypothetical protein [Planctomycetota bacterium]
MKTTTLALVPMLLACAAAAQTGQNVNHARTGAATQSADHPTYPTGVASRLIDGNRSGVWADNSANITASMAAPWWQVVLAGPRLVHEVVLYTRSDTDNASCRDLLVELKTGSTLLWSQTVCTGGAYPRRGVAVRLLMPPGGITCDTVRLSRPGVASGVISLGEVEVLQIAQITPVNWAVYGTAAHFPGGTNYGAANAIDGNTDCNMANNSCVLTSVNGAGGGDWWEVQLPRKRYNEVRVWPSNFQSLYTFYVRAFDGTTTVATHLVSNPTGPGPVVIPLTGSPAPQIDRVRLFRNSFQSPLAFAEVEVIHYSALDSAVTTFGIGCPGTAGTPVLRPLTPPAIAGNFDVEVRNVPATPGGVFLLTGFSRSTYGALPLPFDLGLIGAGGCLVHCSVELTQAATATAGVATSRLPIPNLSGLYGAEVHQQALVPDPGANAFGLTASNPLRVRVGGG